MSKQKHMVGCEKKIPNHHDKTTIHIRLIAIIIFVELRYDFSPHSFDLLLLHYTFSKLLEIPTIVNTYLEELSLEHYKNGIQ